MFINAGLLCLAIAFLQGCGYVQSYWNGYRGSDLTDKGESFFVLGTQTNYLPRRVLVLYENKYAVSERERALFSNLNVLSPSETLSEIPDGFVLRDSEPMFNVYTKESSALDEKGSSGFVCRYDGEKYLVCETFFSIYTADDKFAAQKMAETKAKFIERCKPLKVYDFDNAYVAEYIRFSVVCVLGKMPDGRNSVMFSVRDKIPSPAAQWLSVEEQQEIIDEEKAFLKKKSASESNGS